MRGIQVVFIAFVVLVHLQVTVDGNDQEGNVCSGEDHTCSAGSDCIDTANDCTELARNGECQSNQLWMLTNCPFSCKHCPNDYGYVLYLGPVFSLLQIVFIAPTH